LRLLVAVFPEVMRGFVTRSAGFILGVGRGHELPD
jgi:hypothetical protein